MKVAVIRYNAGNTKSVLNALKRLKVEALVTANRREILAADRVILPGVGEAGSALKSLNENGIDRVIPKLEKPMLGICLGLAALCESSEEGDTKGLAIFPHKVKKFSSELKIPHMGWNRAAANDNEGDFFYFVHSYYAELGPCTYMQTNYGIDFSSALKRDNFNAVQFHPEKSSQAGADLIAKFIQTGGI